MRSQSSALAVLFSAATAHAAASLSDVCTTAYVKASLPSDNFYQGIVVDPSSVLVNSVLQANSTGADFFPDAVFDYCNVTFAYSHTGRNDQVLVTYWLPTPASFQDRFLSTGGGGYAINSGTGLTGSLPGAVIYGAVGGATDGGFGSFTTNSDVHFLIQNNTINYEDLYMFGYNGIHELTLLGQQFTKQFFNMTSENKLYSYYQGCSEGGREGWSQAQRFADQFDGVIVGAPAFRFSFQQIQHLWSNVVEQTMGYYPPACELQKILNETLTACDGLDGRIDGVVGRTDLCKLQFNISSIVGKSYYCPASPVYDGFPPAPAWPEQNGTVTSKAVAVANKILGGMQNNKGEQVYLSYQPSAIWADAYTSYNFDNDTWGLYISTFGTEFVERYLNLQNSSDLANLNGVTYDTLQDYIVEGWQRYQDTLHTTWPDLTPFRKAGGKILHFHGESDFSIPTASSVRYHESVRHTMYPHMSFNASSAALSEWYKLFLVPGAQHCAPNVFEPNGPFPQTNLGVMIEWVEKGVEPKTLNATVLAGEDQGQNQQICAWPLRPHWQNNGTELECVYDQPSINSWLYDLDAFNMVVY